VLGSSNFTKAPPLRIWGRSANNLTNLPTFPITPNVPHYVRKQEECEKGDARILGSGVFVEEILQESNELYEMKTRNRISLDDLILKVSSKVDLDMEDLKSSKRNRKVSYARAVISYLAVNQFGWNASEVARKLRISGMGVGKCVDRGKKIFDKPEIMKEYLAQV